MLGMLQLVIYGLAGIMVVGGIIAWLLDARLTSLSDENRFAWVGFIIFLLSLGMGVSLVWTADNFAAELRQSVEKALSIGRSMEEEGGVMYTPQYLSPEEMERRRQEYEMRRQRMEALRQQAIRELEYQAAQDAFMMNR